MQTVLDAGQWYEIEAAGTFDAWGTTPHGIDAVWCFKPGRCNTPQPWQQLRVDNQGFEDFAKKWMGESFELPYKRNHLYSIRVQGEGRPLTFHLWDAIEQNSAGGNLGSLTVRVYRIGGGTPTGISGGGRYTRIPKTAIPGHNIQSLSNVTVADCERACDQRSDCLTFDYTRGGTTCYVQNTADGAVSSNSYDHYIKPGVRTAVAGTSTGPDRLGTRWDEEEVAGWKGVWTRRGNTNVFDARWERPGSTAATAVLTIELNGNTVRIERRHDNGQGCTYTGTLAPDGVTVSGKYGCDSAPGPFDWKATISRGSGGSASTGPASAASPSPAGGPVRGVRRGDTEQALDMIVVQANNPTPVRSNVVLQTGEALLHSGDGRLQCLGRPQRWSRRGLVLSRDEVSQPRRMESASDRRPRDVRVGRARDPLQRRPRLYRSVCGKGSACRVLDRGRARLVRRQQRIRPSVDRRRERSRAGQAFDCAGRRTADSGWCPTAGGTRCRRVGDRNCAARIDAGAAAASPSSPGEFHPEALTEPDISLSTYPARATP